MHPNVEITVTGRLELQYSARSRFGGRFSGAIRFRGTGKDAEAVGQACVEQARNWVALRAQEWLDLKVSPAV